MFRNRLEVVAFGLSMAGAASMILIPVLVVRSGYTIIYMVPFPVDIQGFQEVIYAWVAGGIIAILAGLLFVALPMTRKFASCVLAFSALVYWSGFFSEAFFFIPSDPAWFAWPSILVIAGVVLLWISWSGRRMSKGFWLSLIGGSLMLSLSLPPLVISWGYVIAKESPYVFLGISSMAFGGLLTLLVSLILGIFPSTPESTRSLSLSGVIYYLVGLLVLLMNNNPRSTLTGSILSIFVSIGLAFSVPALLAMTVIPRADRKPV